MIANNLTANNASNPVFDECSDDFCQLLSPSSYIPSLLRLSGYCSSDFLFCWNDAPVIWFSTVLNFDHLFVFFNYRTI